MKIVPDMERLEDFLLGMDAPAAITALFQTQDAAGPGAGIECIKVPTATGRTHNPFGLGFRTYV
jgi:hypothetical protein